MNGTFSNSFYEATITLSPKTDKNTKKKKKKKREEEKKRKLQVNISDEYRCKNPQQNISELNSTIYKKDHTSCSSGIYSRDARMVQYPPINQCDIPHLQKEE